MAKHVAAGRVTSRWRSEESRGRADIAVLQTPLFRRQVTVPPLLNEEQAGVLYAMHDEGDDE